MLLIEKEIHNFFKYYPICSKVKQFIKNKLILLIFHKKIKIPNINRFLGKTNIKKDFEIWKLNI